jgi:hypothetical protein
LSEAEAFTAFMDLGDAYATQLFGFIGLMSGFLIMSYFAADKLPTTLVAIVLALFSIVSAAMVFRMNLIRNNLNALISYVVDQKTIGNYDLPWFPLSGGSGPLVSYLEFAAIVGGFIGCFVFFFYQRNTARDDT